MADSVMDGSPYMLLIVLYIAIVLYMLWRYHLIKLGKIMNINVIIL